MKFWLGTHQTGWLATAAVPLFVSHRRLAQRKRLPVAAGPWALDSGGFTELGKYGEWQITEVEYVALVRRYRDEVGRLAWAAPMDWMCEPAVCKATGRSVAEHQIRTVHGLLYLRHLAPELPIIPVLQGYTLDDYLRCADLYERCGVDLAAEPLVGVGSVCRRQATAEIGRLLSRLASYGFRLHGFGVKTSGLALYSHSLASADSMAWSYRGRHVPGCSPSHKAENNCRAFAFSWRSRMLAATATSLAAGRQAELLL